MSLEAAYWIALATGVSFLVLSLVLGDVFDFLDFGLGDSFSATPVLFTGLAAFGGGGLLALNAFGMGQGGSVVAGIGSSVVAGGVAAGLFVVLQRQESKESFKVDQLVGARGRVMLAIPAGKEGKVAVQHQGMTRTFAASSQQAVATGEEVVVVDVLGTSLRVSPFADQA